jgi:hypothetical protein
MVYMIYIWYIYGFLQQQIIYSFFVKLSITVFHSSVYPTLKGCIDVYIWLILLYSIIAIYSQ